MDNERTLDLLSQMNDRMNNKFETSIQINMTTSQIRVPLPEPIKLNPKLSYKVGVRLFSVFNMPRIVNSTNNKFRYSKDSGATWKTVTLNPGAYEYTDLNNEIKRQLELNSDWVDKAIEIGTDIPAGRFTLTLKAGYQVDFTISNSIRLILGFFSKIITFTGTTTADDIGNIEGGINTINIKTDITNGGYITNERGDLVRKGIVYSIPFLSVGIGQKIIDKQQTPVFYDINQNNISAIYVSIIDEKDRLIDFGGQNITVVFHIKQV